MLCVSSLQWCGGADSGGESGGGLLLPRHRALRLLLYWLMKDPGSRGVQTSTPQGIIANIGDARLRNHSQGCDPLRRSFWEGPALLRFNRRP